MKNPGTLFAASITTLLLSGPALAETYSFTAYMPPTHNLTKRIVIDWADAVREASNGEIDFEVFAGGSLLPALGTMQGLADGVAQAGYLPSLYHPSEIPHAVVVGELGHQTPDPFVLSAAYIDYTMNEPVAIEEWQRNGILPTATTSTNIYYFVCRDELRTLDDLNGKRVRAPGGGWARFSEYIGMTPVNIPSSELYTSLERGAVDCVNTELPELTAGSNLLELTESIIMLPLSPAYTLSSITYDLDFWRSLTNEQRRLLLDETAIAMARTLVYSNEDAEEALEAARSQGVKVVEPGSDLQNAYQDWINNGLGGLVELAENRYRIADAQSYLDTFQQYIAKWNSLLADVDRADVDAVGEIFKTDLFDQVDVSSYGMN